MKLIKNLMIIFLVNSAAFAQLTSFQNIEVIPSEDTVKISYDIWGGYDQESYFIDLDVSSDGGASFRIIPRNPEGDVGYGIKKGYGKKIWWEPLKDAIELVGDKFIFKLKLSVLGSSPTIEFVKISGGTFNMGDEFGDGNFDERPPKSVTLDDFEIGKFEVTNAQYSIFLQVYDDDEVKSGEYEGEKMIYENDKGLKYFQNVWKPAVGYENFPIVGVTWYGANEFCRYYHYRLPTEAEWEYASRDRGKKVKFGNGKEKPNLKEINYYPDDFIDSTEQSNLKINSGNQQSVGAYPPNDLGIFQMSGNVWEWCLDWYESSYDQSKTINPTGPWLGKWKVIRGGSFNNISTAVRTTERSFMVPHYYNSDVGFRVARSNLSQEIIQEEMSDE